MRAANANTSRHDDPPAAVDNDEIDLELAADHAAPHADGGWGTDASPEENAAGDDLTTSQLRWRLAAVAGFLAVFHLMFAAIKMTGPASALTASSDTPTWSLLLRGTLAGVACAFLLSSLRLSRRQVRWVEGCLFGFEMLILLAAQYLSAIDLIAHRDLVDAVAVQKNGVIRVIVLMICYGVFVPRAPVATARIVVTMAAALILCHGVVLNHANTTNLTIDDLANQQIVMANALFLIMGVALATLAAWVLRGRGADESAPDRVGPYRLLRKLDEGGTGEVYLAEHDSLQRPCVLKFVRPGDEEAAARFKREVLAAAMLSHPNTVSVFDSGRTRDGVPYCAMEYLPGLNIADIVNGSGPMPASRAVYLGRQVCGALAEIHRFGFIHRDVSPSNVFAGVLGGRCDVAKVLDLGAVGGQIVGDAPAADGGIAGTPEYVAPEQAVSGRGIDGRADIYGLGALLYFMVTGVPPFQHDAATGVLRAHVSEQVRPPRELVADVPADVEAVILRCLAKRPEDRFRDARAVADALGACACAAEWDEAHAERWWSEGRMIGAAPSPVQVESLPRP